MRPVPDLLKAELLVVRVVLIEAEEADLVQVEIETDHLQNFDGHSAESFGLSIVADVHEGGYEDRWCYDEFAEAAGALEDWRAQGFAGEPEGWHRHPQTGRRRAEDGSVYLNP